MRENIPIAISMGDPSGIGPEVLAKALNSLDRTNGAVFLLSAMPVFFHIMVLKKEMIFL